MGNLSTFVPRNEGSRYRNYNGKNSIVPLDLTDAEYKFLIIDIGRNGSITIQMSCKSIMSGYTYKLLYVYAGNDAYALKENLMKGF